MGSELTKKSTSRYIINDENFRLLEKNLLEYSDLPKE